jgi:hypothetical protein
MRGLNVPGSSRPRLRRIRRWTSCHECGEENAGCLVIIVVVVLVIVNDPFLHPLILQSFGKIGKTILDHGTSLLW